MNPSLRHSGEQLGSHSDERSETESVVRRDELPSASDNGFRADARNDSNSDARHDTTAVSRRDALTLALLSPLAAVAANPHIERLQKFMGSLAVMEEQGQTYTPKFFTPKEWRTVRILADYVIPKDERSGSATDAKAPEYMDFVMNDEQTSEANRIAMRGGLAWLDNECRHRFSAKTFVEATDAQRREVLDDIAWPRNAKPEMSQGAAFFNRFRDMTAAGFFSSAMGWKDLQYVGNVFNPNWQGCPQPALDKLGVSYDLMSSFVRPEKG
jgi:gluconate 2-dehydrogenase gamma chain